MSPIVSYCLWTMALSQGPHMLDNVSFIYIVPRTYLLQMLLASCPEHSVCSELNQSCLHGVICQHSLISCISCKPGFWSRGLLRSCLILFFSSARLLCGWLCVLPIASLQGTYNVGLSLFLWCSDWSVCYCAVRFAWQLCIFLLAFHTMILTAIDDCWPDPSLH